MPGCWTALALTLAVLVGCQKVERGEHPPAPHPAPSPLPKVTDAALPDAAIPDGAVTFRLDQDGGADPERTGIRLAMRSLTPAFQRCVQTAGFQGKVILHFTIDGAGAVRTPSAEGSPPALTQCLLAQVGALHFGPPRGGGIIAVSFPVIFN